MAFEEKHKTISRSNPKKETHKIPKETPGKKLCQGYRWTPLIEQLFVPLLHYGGVKKDLVDESLFGRIS